MKKSAVLVNSYLVILILILSSVLGMGCVLAKTESITDPWKINESIILKLKTEWEKMDNISRNLMSLNDILSEMRDLELYPVELTNLSDNNLLKYDKKIEALEKQSKIIQQKVLIEKAHLVDALEIVKELVISGPVHGMVNVLENGSKKRFNELVKTKRDTDSLWVLSDSILEDIMNTLGIAFKSEIDKQYDEKPSKILQINQANQAQDFYLRLDRIKDNLSKKADVLQLEKLYKIEKFRLQKLIEEDKSDLAKQKILSMKNRYFSKNFLDELNIQLAKVEFSAKKYEIVLSIISSISEVNRNRDLLLLLKIQSLYFLKEYRNIWDNYRKYDISKLSGARKNLFIWIMIECGIVLKIDDDYAMLASLIDNGFSYTHHVLHALARTYLFKNDQKTAVSIMESALKYKVIDENDKIALKEIKIFLAQIKYEMSDYEKSLNLFYQILNEHDDFERALFGIVWCYLKLDNDSKAELALRKLINLTPESPYAVEAILILAKKNFLRANSEWKKDIYLDKEEKRLSAKLDYIIEKQKSITDKNDLLKYGYAQKELHGLIQRLKSEKRIGYDSTRVLYEKIDDICDLINKHYQTGTFQEDLFTVKREKTLFFLDSIINGIKKTNSKDNKSPVLSNNTQQRVKIKNVVKKMNVFAVIAAIDRFRWEREFLDWKKSNLRNEEMKLDSGILRVQDTVKIKKFKEAQNMIRKELDSIIISEEKIIRRYTKGLKSRIDKILGEEIDSTEAAYLYYQSGELWYIEENIEYAAMYAKYEMEMERYYLLLDDFRNGKKQERPVEPSHPILNHDMSMEKFRKIISDYPNSLYLASANYSMAWCFNDLGLYDSALYYMEILADKYPESQYAAQAWMYSGEHHFDKGELDNAIKSYQAVLKFPESEWFEEALYKLAWSQYRLSNPEKAISSFLALVDLGDGTSSGAALLEKESMDYIAISFSESDITGEKGLDRAMMFVSKLEDEDKGCRILHRLASVFKEQGRYEIARKTYSNLLDKYPKYAQNAFVETEMVKLAEREVSLYDVNKMKISIFEKYNKNSQWASKQSDKIRREADSIADKQLYDGAIGYHQYALQKNDTVAYRNALKAYKNYITFYASSNLANECHYNLAEILFAVGKYDEAAEEYMAVTKRYPDSKYRETAAWNAIVASQNFLKQENESVKTIR